VFQLVYLTPSDLTIRVILVFKSGFATAANETTAEFSPHNPFQYAPKPIFKPPGHDYPHERLQ
jgi:hypothetical protein